MGMPESWINGIQQWAETSAAFAKSGCSEVGPGGDHEDSSDVDLALTLTTPNGLPGRFPSNWALLKFFNSETKRAWRAELERIVGRDVDLELVGPETSPRTLIWRRGG